MPVFGGISAAIALGGLALSATQMAKAKKEKRKAEAEEAQAKAAQQSYATPSSVKDQLADAQSRLGAVNPALVQAYQQAQLSQANQASFAQRNASSGAQALAASADAASNTQSILPTLAGQQTAFDQTNRGMLVDALRAKTEDERMKFTIGQEQNQAAQQYALGKVGAAQQDKSQAIGLGLSALGTAAGMYGAYRQNPTMPATVNTRGANLTATTPLNSSAGVAQYPVGGTALNTPQNLTPMQLMWYRKMGYTTPPFNPGRLY